jgi:hypothetical protein
VDENYSYQLSVKFGDHDQMMANVRGSTEEQFNARLRYLIDNAGTVALAAETVRATAVDSGTVQAGVGTPQYAQPAQVQQPAPGGAQPAPAQQPSTCAHGPMTYRTGMGKNNKPYAAWFCPAPQNQPRCAPVFL